MEERIHLLPALVANLIAAGEVIERPASVVKELLENSLDAQARRIQIDIEKGGTQLIRVRDDGVGISKEDLYKAPLRHATSKIREAKDLDRIMSLGFRGEALASIDSIAHLSITSLTDSGTTAWKLYRATDSTEYTLEPAAHPRGTTVEVSELFCYAPVRRKFLRAEKTEYLYLEDLIKRMILARFDVGFTLRHNQRLIVQARAGNSEAEQDKRLANICGNPFLKNTLRIDSEYEGMRLWGWLGLPQFHRSQNDLQYLYVNGRIIKDKVLNHAIRSAYLDSLDEGRYPCYVIYLTLPPETVDVNVHPTKQEVRFSDARVLHGWLAMTLKEALRDALSVKMAVDQEPWPEPVVSVEARVEPLEPALNSVMPLEPKRLFEEPSRLTATVLQTTAPLTQRTSTPLEVYSHTEDKVLAIIQGRFLVLKRGDKIAYIDAQALQKTKIADRLSRALQGEPLKAQWLLLPQTYELKTVNETLILNLQKKWQALGIDFEWRQDEQLIITLRQLPALLRECFNSSTLVACFEIVDKAESDPEVWVQAMIPTLEFPEQYFKKMNLEVLQQLWNSSAFLSGSEELLQWIEIPGR